MNVLPYYSVYCLKKTQIAEEKLHGKLPRKHSTLSHNSSLNNQQPYCTFLILKLFFKVFSLFFVNNKSSVFQLHMATNYTFLQLMGSAPHSEPLLAFACIHLVDAFNQSHLEVRRNEKTLKEAVLYRTELCAHITKHSSRC